MENAEFIEFLKTTLIKIENVINFIDQDVPKHIPAYNKILGIQQKFSCIDENIRCKMLSQMLTIRSIINYFTNGRYLDGYDQLIKLKQELIKICIEMEKNERNKNE